LLKGYFVYSISEDTLNHILRRHPDVIEKLNIRSLQELADFLQSVVTNPDEVYVDAKDSNVLYYLRTLNDLRIVVVVKGGKVKTCYLLGWVSYQRFRRRRWLKL
jgi:hypothetical protein